MIDRHYLQRLKQLLRNFPVVCVLGPRQCGKTTFIKKALSSWQYLDLERPADFARISEDPQDTLGRLKNKFILDEAQQVPQIFQALRSFVDEKPNKNGQLVLLGSASPVFIKQISETLAGRTGFLDMTPFLWCEVRNNIKNINFEKFWHRGGFPDACMKKTDNNRLDWFDAYTRTFIERDLTALDINVTPSQMRKLWTMLAHYNGQIWNASQLASSLGVSYHTVNRYTDILEQTFLIRKLPPYFTNIGKRLVKSPKICFRDTGLLHYFLGINTLKILDTHPSRGGSWETFIIEQLIAAYSLHVPGSQVFYWRTATGVEIDLLVVNGTRLIPFEIKLNSSPIKRDARSLLMGMQDLQIKKGYLLYPGNEDFSLGNGVVVKSAEKLLADPKLIKKI